MAIRSDGEHSLTLSRTNNQGKYCRILPPSYEIQVLPYQLDDDIKSVNIQDTALSRRDWNLANRLQEQRRVSLVPNTAGPNLTMKKPLHVRHSGRRYLGIV